MLYDTLFTIVQYVFVLSIISVPFIYMIVCIIKDKRRTARIEELSATQCTSDKLVYEDIDLHNVVADQEDVIYVKKLVFKRCTNISPSLLKQKFMVIERLTIKDCPDINGDIINEIKTIYNDDCKVAVIEGKLRIDKTVSYFSGHFLINMFMLIMLFPLIAISTESNKQLRRHNMGPESILYDLSKDE
jgi:hypothetical protein